MATFRTPKCLIGVLACAALLGACLSCTNTLDPSVDGPADAGSEGGAGSLPTCSSFAQTPSSYVVCPEPLDYQAAAFDCMRRGATLAAIGSQPENDFVATNGGNVANDDLWLGGTRDDSYVWRWPDGTVFWRGETDGAAENGSFVSWFPGEPNDASTVTTDPERCLALRVNRTAWNDRACSLQLPYVCEQATPTP